MNKPDSILSGAAELIDEALHYRHRRSCQELATRPAGFNADQLLDRLYACIKTNRSHWPGRPPSTKNWRWEPQRDYKTKSKEVVREREMIKSLEPGERRCWANQIPVASGLLNSTADRRRTIDLAHLCQKHQHRSGYVLIELKIKSNTPLYAAFEVLQYGLLLVFSREVLCYDTAKRPLLRADHIHLRVLAPVEYYNSCKLDWLEKDLSQAIGRFARKEADVGMDFSFWQCERKLPARDWVKYWERGKGKRVKWLDRP